eukprot:612472-Rhodomonas_salina.2
MSSCSSCANHRFRAPVSSSSNLANAFSSVAFRFAHSACRPAASPSRPPCSAPPPNRSEARVQARARVWEVVEVGLCAACCWGERKASKAARASARKSDALPLRSTTSTG